MKRKMVQWLILIISIVLALVCFVFWTDDFGISVPGMLIGVVLSTFAVCVGIWMISLHYDRNACKNWSRQTGRPSKFAYYNAFSWECLTKTHDNKWISINQVGDYNK